MKDTRPVSKRACMLGDMISKLNRFMTDSKWARQFGGPDVSDFTLGNPHDFPLEEFVKAMQRWIVPKDRYWFAYKRNEPEVQRVVAGSLTASHGMEFSPEDIFMTNGATAALSVIIGAITDPGDEIVYISPPWFLYESIIVYAAGVPIKVKLDPGTFDLDPEAIARVLNGRTRAIIVNSPQNPTGKIYPPEALRTLSEILTEAGKKYGRTIYLISDEAYRKILFDGRTYSSPMAFYAPSVVVYTYGKALLAPGQRIGYIALNPSIPDRESLRRTIPVLQMVNGWSFPNALLQLAIEDIEKISIDMSRLQARRDRLVSALRGMGYETNIPEGTFYILCRSPLPDEDAFTDMLADRGIFCISGALLDLPGFFRISATASDAMIDRALPGFAAAMAQASVLKASKDR